jgi:hypothetical protein
MDSLDTDESTFSSKEHFWLFLTIISSTLSYLVNFMRCTIIVNKNSICFQGILVIFLSFLFRQISLLLLIFTLILFSLNSFFDDDDDDPFFGTATAQFFLFLFVQHATSQFFSHQKLYAKSFLGYLAVFWTSTVGRKKYVYSFPKLFYKKKVMYKFNLSKVMWPLGVLFKFIFYSLMLANFSTKTDIREITRKVLSYTFTDWGFL